MRHRILALALTLTATLATASAAAASAPGVIQGDPLQIYIDGVGHLQVQLTGFPTPELDPANLNLADPNRESALILTVIASGTWQPCQPATPGGPPGPTPVSGPTAPTGSGTVADPFTITAVFDCKTLPGPVPGGLQITETITYVNGDSDFVASYAMTNLPGPGTTPLMFRATAFGQVDLGGAGAGAGFHDAAGDIGPGSPETVGAFNDDAGSQAEISQVASAPWSSYMEGNVGNVEFLSRAARFDTIGPGLDDSIGSFGPTPALAAQDNRNTAVGLAVGAADTFAVDWSFVDYAGLTLTADADTKQVGSTANVSAISLDHGQPASGLPIRYAITGANPSAGAVTTAADGTATISWTGTQPGTDTLTAFTDVKGTGTYDPSVDTQQTVTVTWTTPPPPPPAPPVNTATPAISGAPAVGQQLACSPGAWSGATPQTYLYTWLRDGSAIGAPSTASTYVVTAADAGHAVACQVTATNAVATAAARSAAVAIPAALRIGVARAAIHLASLLRSGLAAHVSCSAACRPTATLSVAPAEARLLGLTRTLGKRAFVLGSASAGLDQAGTETVRVTLRARPEAALRRTRQQTITIALTAMATDAAGHAAPPAHATLTVRR